MLERQYECGRFNAGVVVDHGDLVRGGNSDGSMLAGSRQGALCARQCSIGRQILVGGVAVRPELFVFGRPAGTVSASAFSGALVATRPPSNQRAQPARWA